jgi:hypothetical protein
LKQSLGAFLLRNVKSCGKLVRFNVWKKFAVVLMMFFSSQHWLLTVSMHVAALTVITRQKQTGGMCHSSAYLNVMSMVWILPFSRTPRSLNKKIVLKKS